MTAGTDGDARRTIGPLPRINVDADHGRHA
jgi:hypothetical protein